MSRMQLATRAQSAPVGVVLPYAGAAAPDGWLLCDGRAVSRVQFADLFGALGTVFGAGDGATTFNVPDMRGRLPLGMDNLGGTSANRVAAAAAATRGGNAGTENVTLTTSQLPGHSHTVTRRTGTLGSTVGIATTTTADSSATESTSSIGSGQAHPNMPPYLALGYIVRAV
jgi:microcystin-dependent protein